MGVRLTTITATAVAVLAIAACGSSGSSSSSSAPPSTSTTATTTSSTQPTTSASSSLTTATTQASTSSTTTATTTTAAAAATCKAAGLELSFLGQLAATGHGKLGFAVRNTQSASCTTSGYPTVLFLGRSGAPLPTGPVDTTSDFFGQSSLVPVTVTPGQTASFRLGVTHVSGSGASCATAYALQVTPPGDTATMHVAIPGGAIECGTATVSPMQPGTSAY